MIHHIRQTTSSNDEACDPRYHHGDIVWADFQTAGRGQRGHTWLSREGENLTFSLVLEPTFLPVGEQFLITEVVALSLTDTFDQFGIPTRIKWTNDIYAGDRKMVGILIEHGHVSETLQRTILGIGINVNQHTFDPTLPNPTSMCVEAGHAFDLEKVLHTFLACCMERYAQLERGDKAALQADYRARMYRLGEEHDYRLPDGTFIRASIEGVEPTGQLILRHKDGSQRKYLFREVEFVLNL